MDCFVGMGNLRRIKSDGAYRIDGDGLGGFKGSADFISERSGEHIHALVLKSERTSLVGQCTLDRIRKGDGLTILGNAPVDIQTVSLLQSCYHIKSCISVGRS